MGQILSMMWRWVSPQEPKRLSNGGFERRRYVDDDDKQNDIISAFLSVNDRKSSDHRIDILDPQPISDSLFVNDDDDDDEQNFLISPSLSVNDRKSSDHCIDIFDPQRISDSLSIFEPKDAENEDYLYPAEADSDKILQVVSEGTDNDERIHEGVWFSDLSLCSSERKSIGAYNSSQTILLVGEGDFSFSACLAKAFGSASNIVATSLNSVEFLFENYGNFPSNQLELQTRGSILLHGVDATNMAQQHRPLAKLKFDRIIYNFPHAGFKQDSPEAQMKRHKKLVRGFLKNAKKMMEEDGQIHITHKSNPFFLKWDIPKLGTDQGLHLIQQVKFKRSKFPGYHTKYGFGGDKDFDCNPSKTYKFTLTTKTT